MLCPVSSSCLYNVSCMWALLNKVKKQDGKHTVFIPPTRLEQLCCYCKYKLIPIIFKNTKRFFTAFPLGCLQFHFHKHTIHYAWQIQRRLICLSKRAKVNSCINTNDQLLKSFKTWPQLISEVILNVLSRWEKEQMFKKAIPF